MQYVTKVLGRLLLAILYVLANGCAHAIRLPPKVARFDTTIVYYGELTGPGLAQAKLADESTARTLLVRSDGGAVAVGMDFGEWIYKRGLDVIVDEYCLSSCANYVFVAGHHKTILPGGIVAWHGNTRQSDADAQTASLPVGIQPLAKSLMHTWRERESAFYALTGVSECLDRIGIDVLGAHGLYTMSSRDMERFGVHNVVGAPNSRDDVAERLRKELSFEFISIPKAMDANSACP